MLTFVAFNRRRVMKSSVQIIRHSVLGVLLLGVWMTQAVAAWGEGYAQSVYPAISYCLSALSNLFPFALGDLFIFLSIAGILSYPIYGYIKKHPWKRVVRREVEYLLWIYVWFYLAWGLNYSQRSFYGRTQIAYTAYTPDNFGRFVDEYIERLNASYIMVNEIQKEVVCQEVVAQYILISDTLGVHRPPHASARAKTMLFTPLISLVGVTGSMGPFFCEFTLNGHLLPPQYPATYAHELAHLLGITSEAEANFYAYQVCTRSQVAQIRFSGYLSVLGHVLGNARRLLTEEEYQLLFNRVRPEIITLVRQNQAYWEAKYSPIIGDIQDWIYDFYLKGNKIESGRKNYSEVVGLLISYREWNIKK